MDGTRFGVGVMVGLLLAVGVVAASGGLGSLSPYAAAPASYQTTTETATTETAYSVSGSSTGTPWGTLTPNSTSSITGNETNTVATSSNLYVQSLIGNLPSSRFAAVVTQSPTTNAILVVPVLLALLLGAVLFRASTRGRTSPNVED